MRDRGRQSRIAWNPLNRREAVADAVDSSNHVLVAARIAKLLPDGTDVSFEQGGVGYILVSPDLLRQKRMREGLPRIPHELSQDVHLDRCAVQALAVERRKVVGYVDVDSVQRQAL